MLAQTFEDFEENNGLEFKMFFNEVKKEAANMRQKALPPLKTKEEARDEIEEIEILIEKLKNVSSRVERRKLLA